MKAFNDISYKEFEEMGIPGGLSQEEVDEAIRLFRRMRKTCALPNRDLWKIAISAIIYTSEDFDEATGLDGMISHYYGNDNIEVHQ